MSRRDPYAPSFWAIGCVLTILAVVVLGHLITVAVR